MPMKKVLSFPGKSHHIAKCWTDDLDDATRDQIWDTLTLPFIFKHVAVMPDAHVGIGSTVGTVLATRAAIVPAAVGVDIGCGMMAMMLDLKATDLPDNLRKIRLAIEKAVPHGRTDNGGVNDRGAWGEPPRDVQLAGYKLSCDDRFVKLIADHPDCGAKFTRACAQLGTLGGGNHFVELCLDKQDYVWMMLHSGSRGIGNKIGTYFIDRAKEQMEQWHIELVDPNLAYLPRGTKMFDDYWSALSWAQDYAKENRTLMMIHAVAALSEELGRLVQGTLAEPVVSCHHNYASLEHHFGENVYVTRKGAVRARVGDLGIIPGSMGARSFIVRGKGNPDTFHSCSHGAGRVMSRSEAKRRYNLADLEAQTAGVECRRDADVVDEIPAAYKDIHTVMENQTDLVEVLYELRQIVCVKG